MGYVALKQLKIGGSTVQPGTQIATATAESWPTLDTYLNEGSVRYVDDSQIAQFITDYAAGNVTFAERTSRPDRSIQKHRTTAGQAGPGRSGGDAR